MPPYKLREPIDDEINRLHKLAMLIILLRQVRYGIFPEERDIKLKRLLS